MKLRKVYVIGLIVLIAAILVWVQFRSREVAANVSSANPSTVRASTTRKLAAAANSSKPVKFKETDVYFLNEANSASHSRTRPSSMRQPAVNGSRRIGVARPLTSKQEGTFIHPRWSPDGLELMFSKPGYDGLYTKSSRGGAMSTVTEKSGVGFKARWKNNGDIETETNDGEFQAFKSDGTPMDAAEFEANPGLTGAFTKDDAVYVRLNSGEAPRPITDDSDRYYGGVISPDGKFIAYNGLHTGLYVAPLDGSSEPVSLGEGYSPCWMPDSSGVLYNISQDDGHNILASDLFISSIDGSIVSNITGTPNASELNPSISPDGQSVAYEVDGVIYIADLH